jgi:hypothetical protein
MIRIERENRTAIWNFGLQRGNLSICLALVEAKYGDRRAGRR